MSKLTHLADEICAGAEIYFTGRTGGQYWKTAFILCDDHTELASKLYLLENVSGWTDKHNNGSFKNYPQILEEVYTSITDHSPADEIHTVRGSMLERRNRRNGFFHSAELLDLNVNGRMCVEAFCDLFRYCELLFAEQWNRVVEGARNLATLVLLFRLEQMAFSDPDVTARVAAIVEKSPRNRMSSRKTGVHIAVYPEDLHLRLCLVSGGNQLRDQLAQLLSECEIGA